MEKLIKYNSNANQTAFGQFGFNELVSGVAAVATDRFAVLQAKGDTVFAFDNEVDNGLTTSAAFTMSDGDVLYGFFKNVVVASGRLRVYYTKN
jgi:hypothetical protein